jgi:hypothetical protein
VDELKQMMREAGMSYHERQMDKENTAPNTTEYHTFSQVN